MKIQWSADLMIYALMILMGVFVWFIAFKNEKSTMGKVLASAGVFLFVSLFVVLFFLKLFTIV